MIDVVIPARNEGQTIAPIVNTLIAHPMIGNVWIIVDADTTDNTAERARILYPDPHVITGTAKGKGQCVTVGLANVTTDRVMFCDADYRGFCFAHIDRLTFHPDHDAMLIGVPDFPRLTDIPPAFQGRIDWAWPWMSGIRIVDTTIARSLDLVGYLMETQLNHAYHSKGIGVKFIGLPNLISPLNLDEKRLEEMERDRQIGIEKGLLPQ
jgi:glycosyltransferase involved in cell wall biosynthesis